MAAYLAAVRNTEKSFDGFEVRHVKRRFNLAADELSKLASSRAIIPSGIFQENLRQPSVPAANRNEGGFLRPSSEALADPPARVLDR